MNNVLWAWCAHAPQRKRAVFTVWAHLLINGRYVMWEGEAAPYAKSNGGRELHRILRAAMQAGDEALGVVCYVKDATAQDWKRESYEDDGVLVLRLVEEPEGIVAYVQGEVATNVALLGTITTSSPVRFAVDDVGELPPGVQNPERVQRQTMGYMRDDRVRKFVLDRAKGCCEYCGGSEFTLQNGRPYLEAHHIIGLAVQGPDTVHNVIALCASHHREAHYGVRAEELEIDFMRRLTELNQP